MCLCVWFVIYCVMVDGLFVCVCFVRCLLVSFVKMCVLRISYDLMLSVLLLLVLECCLRLCVLFQRDCMICF